MSRHAALFCLLLVSGVAVPSSSAPVGAPLPSRKIPVATLHACDIAEVIVGGYVGGVAERLQPERDGGGRDMELYVNGEPLGLAPVVRDEWGNPQSGEELVAGPWFSPDGKRVAYSMRTLRPRGGPDSTCMVVDGRRGQEFPGVGVLVWSPDSRRFAYTAWTMDSDNRQHPCVVVDGSVRPLPGAGDSISEPTFTPDSRRLIWKENGGANRLMADGAPWADAEGMFEGLMFSPDSRRVAFVRKDHADGRERCRCSVDGKLGPAYDRIEVKSVVFSPDSRRVAYCAFEGREGCVVVDGQPQPGPEPGWEVAQDSIVFSPDGQHVAYRVGGQQGSYVVVDGERGPAFPLIFDGPVYTSDGASLLYIVCSGEQRLLVEETGGQRHFRALGNTGMPRFVRPYQVVSQSFGYLLNEPIPSEQAWWRPSGANADPAAHVWWMAADGNGEPVLMVDGRKAYVCEANQDFMRLGNWHQVWLRADNTLVFPVTEWRVGDPLDTSVARTLYRAEIPLPAAGEWRRKLVATDAEGRPLGPPVMAEDSQFPGFPLGIPAGPAAQTVTDPATGAPILSDHLLIGFKPGTRYDDIRRQLEAVGWRPVGAIGQLGIVEALLDKTLGSDLSDIEKFLLTFGTMLFFEKVGVLKPVPPEKIEPPPGTVLPPTNADGGLPEWVKDPSREFNDWSATGLTVNWPWRAIGMPGPWQGDLSPTEVGLVDGGFYPDHPDLVGNVTEPAAEAQDEESGQHGTHTSGLVGAEMNDFGVTGGCPSARIHMIQSDTSSKAADAFVRLADEGCRVASYSMGIPWSESALPTDAASEGVRQSAEKAVQERMRILEPAVKYAQEKGMLIFNSAGNDTIDTHWNPFARLAEKYDNVFVVGATGYSQDPGKAHLAYYSDRGPSLTIAAPGGEMYEGYPDFRVEILSCGENAGYRFMQGTSMATPIAAGVAALVWAHYPSLSYQQVRQALLEGAEQGGVRIEGQECYLINAAKALEVARALAPPDPEPTPEPPPPAPSPAPGPAGPESAPDAATGPMSRRQVAELIVAGVADAEVARLIGARGLSFTPTASDVDHYKQLKAGPLCLAALSEGLQSAAAPPPAPVTLTPPPAVEPPKVRRAKRVGLSNETQTVITGTVSWQLPGGAWTPALQWTLKPGMGSWLCVRGVPVRTECYRFEGSGGGSRWEFVRDIGDGGGDSWLNALVHDDERRTPTSTGLVEPDNVRRTSLRNSTDRPIAVAFAWHDPVTDAWVGLNSNLAPGETWAAGPDGEPWLTDRVRIFAETADGKHRWRKDNRDEALEYSHSGEPDKTWDFTLGGLLGITYDTSDLTVMDVAKGSAAARGGAKPYDVVTAVRGAPVATLADVEAAIRGLDNRETCWVDCRHPNDKGFRWQFTKGDAAGAAALGITFVPGVVIGETEKKAPADEAHLKPRDVITSVAGQPTPTGVALLWVLSHCNPDGPVRIEYLRNGKPMTTEALLRPRTSLE